MTNAVIDKSEQELELVGVQGMDYLAPALDLLKPVPKEPMDEWAEKHIVLPANTNALAGPLRLDQTPYIRGILWAIQSPFIEEISGIMGRQVGKTTGMIFVPMAYKAARHPGPSSLMLPDRDMLEDTFMERLIPFITSCDETAAKLTGDPDDLTKRKIRLMDCMIAGIWAGSTSKTMSRPVRDLFRDEIDQYKQHAGNSAGPLKSSAEAVSAFTDSIIVNTSTPTTEDGHIWQELKACQLVFEYVVPCPTCGQMQTLVWPQIKFDPSQRDLYELERQTYYECIACGEKIREHQKFAMTQAGQWRARIVDPPDDDDENLLTAADLILADEPLDVKHSILLEDALRDPYYRKIGFHLPKWVRPHLRNSWGEAARKFMEARRKLKDEGSNSDMRDWVKFWRALPYVDTVEAKSVREIMVNEIDMDRLMCPVDTIAITAGFDPGQGGYWFVLIAWKRDGTPHLLDCGFVDSKDEMRNICWEYNYPVEGSEDRIGVWRGGLDTAGSKYSDEAQTMTEEAYIWLRQFGRGKVYGTRGATGSYKMSGKRMKHSIIDKTPKGKRIKGGLSLWILETSAFKDIIHYRLQLPEGHAGRFTFHQDVDQAYPRHLAAEEKRRDASGKMIWVTKSRLNHLLDCTVIAFALADPECWGGVRVLAGRQGGNGGKKKTRLRRKGLTIDEILDR